MCFWVEQWSEQGQKALCKLLTFFCGHRFNLHSLHKQVINVGCGSQEEMDWQGAWRREVISILDKLFKLAIVMMVMNQIIIGELFLNW